MITATNIRAHAVNTVAWLASAQATIVVPVYQRQYRWDIGGCEQLLSDIRAVADRDADQMHFIGSILSAADSSSPRSGDDTEEWVLIDGQQRITTLMLLVAALFHTIRDEDAALAAELERVLLHAATGDTKLRPHREWAGAFRDVVVGAADGVPAPSRFADNYAFFRSQISADDVARVWRGLQRLEHVAISLGTGANAQQIFESLNSTGEPLRDDELIHNYVLMGLSHAEQLVIEDEYWAAIERSTGDHIASFWAHYLVMVGGREVATTASGRGVYDVFRTHFPRLDPVALRTLAEQWRSFAQLYATLLDPEGEPDPEIRARLHYLNTFGRGMYPLIMALYARHRAGEIERNDLLSVLDDLQSLLLRRDVVSVGSDRLVARLVRASREGIDALAAAISRQTPSDDRVRVALKHSPLPHPEYVLSRLADVDPAQDDLVIDHVFPPAPSDDWTGGDGRRWKDYSEDEQNSHRALAATLGNLALLEEPLAAQVFDADFPDKRTVYGRSSMTVTQPLASIETWGTAAISGRSAELAQQVMTLWRRRGPLVIDDDGLTPILDAIPRRGWPRGWEREFSYVEYVGEHWEVPDIKYLFNRVFKRLWADRRDAVIAYCSRRGGPVYNERAWNGDWDSLDDDHHLYMRWDSRYMMAAVQGVLEEAGLAPEVFVKYSYIGQIM
ncbi:DUF262 domain-containing protein [Microbacterium schleiferi]|uniref:DUF262 domain-containing protein n=1 Tax=Microbacterium schleiferi TaxID=69362 RepID=UPI0035C7E410